MDMDSSSHPPPSTIKLLSFEDYEPYVKTSVSVSLLLSLSFDVQTFYFYLYFLYSIYFHAHLTARRGMGERRGCWGRLEVNLVLMTM